MFTPVPVEDIRSNKITFEDFILRCFDRMDMVLPECVKMDDYKIIDAKLRLIHNVSNFFHDGDANFLREFEKIENTLNRMDTWNYQYYKELMRWIALLSGKFQLMRIIGPTPTTIWMGTPDAGPPKGVVLDEYQP